VGQIVLLVWVNIIYNFGFDFLVDVYVSAIGFWVFGFAFILLWCLLEFL